MSVRIYVEGGGDRAEQKNRLRKGFQEFFKKAGLAGNLPEVIACGSRAKAYDRFSNTVDNKKYTALLVVDAEERVRAPKAWQHLKDRDDWDRPKAATDDQCHLMVQVMESWFLADLDALESYFDQGFKRSALPQNPKIEEVPKLDIETGLRQATRDTKKGRYHKGNHSFDLLGKIDPAKVRRKSPYAKRFLCVLKRMGLE